MSHLINQNWGQSGISQTWNRLNYNVIPSGFLTDVSLTKISSVEVSVPAFTAFIYDSVLNLGVRIENTTTETGIAIAPANPYVVVRLTWVNNSSNDFTIISVAYGSILSTDLIIGLGNFSGATLVDFDYSLQSISFLKYGGLGYDPYRVTVTSNTLLDNSYHIVFVDSTSGNITITLPALLTNVGKSYIIKNIGANKVIINPNGSDLIDGSASLVINNIYESYRLEADTEWYLI